MPPTGSTRWCPTPEQLMMLEELYRRGIRTPTASQIQHIASHLSHYGRIEGKNVFYWFQNHKARDRQKLRKKLLKQQEQQQQLQQQHQTHCHLLPHIEISPPPSSSAAISPDQAHQFLPQRREWKMIDCWGGWMEVEKANQMCEQEWMMMMKMNTSSITPHCNMAAPKTLQLFPVTTKALKDECFTSHQEQYFCCSTSNSSTNC